MNSTAAEASTTTGCGWLVKVNAWAPLQRPSYEGFGRVRSRRCADEFDRIERAPHGSLPGQPGDVPDCLAPAPDASVPIQFGQVAQGDQRRDRLARSFDDDAFASGGLV